MTFGHLKEAEKSAIKVRRIHEKVHGTLFSERELNYLQINEHDHEKTHYSAHNEDAVIWVSATLLETGLWMFQLLIRPLTDEEINSILLENRLFNRFFGVSSEATSPSYVEFKVFSSPLFHLHFPLTYSLSNLSFFSPLSNISWTSLSPFPLNRNTILRCAEKVFMSRILQEILNESFSGL